MTGTRGWSGGLTVCLLDATEKQRQHEEQKGLAGRTANRERKAWQGRYYCLSDW